MSDLPATGPGGPVLKVRDLRVRYRNGALGVLDVSFDVNDGQIVLLLGQNGAGKTTTVRAVSGFLRAEGARVVAGEISLFGRSTANLEPHRCVAMGLAVVPERRKIFPNLTVWENLTALGKLPPKATRQEAYDRVFSLFPVIADRRTELAGRLSGGQQQMLAISRAILNNPRLLILDEITLGLHHSLHQPLFQKVKEIASAGTALVVVAEPTSQALDIADYCYVLDSGVVIDQGKSSDLAQKAV